RCTSAPLRGCGRRSGWSWGNLSWRMNGCLSSHAAAWRGLERQARVPILRAWRPGAAAHTRSPDMSIVRYRQRPSELALHDEIKHVFDRFFGEQDTDASAVVTAQWVPRVDIKEESGRFVIYADLPGIDPKDIEVQMDKGILSIKGERASESTTE